MDDQSADKLILQMKLLVDLFVLPICLGDMHPYFVNDVLYGLKNENDKVEV